MLSNEEFGLLRQLETSVKVGNDVDSFDDLRALMKQYVDEYVDKAEAEYKEWVDTKGYQG